MTTGRRTQGLEAQLERLQRRQRAAVTLGLCALFFVVVAGALPRHAGHSRGLIARVAALEEQVGRMREQLQTLQKRLDSEGTTVSTLRGNLAGLSRQVNAIQAALDAVRAGSADSREARHFIRGAWQIFCKIVDVREVHIGDRGDMQPRDDRLGIPRDLAPHWQPLVRKDRGIAFLSRVRGRFYGWGEQVGVRLVGNEYRLWGSAGKEGLSVSASAVILTIPGE